MGYYSDFQVDETDIPFIKDVLNGATEPYEWYDTCDGLPYTHGKWYDWLTDLETVAKLYPHSYLIIVRYGEEGGDVSRAVVKNGKVFEQRPELVWPEI